MSSQPNIVIIMTDQQRADVSAREGFALDTTPFIDELARDGAWFERAYTAVPICAAARISLLTGRYASAHRVRENRGIQHVLYNEDLIDVVRAKGYATAVVGKNHSHLTPDRVDHWFHLMHAGGAGEDRTPEEVAFDHWLNVLHHGVAQEPTPFPLACQGPYRAVSDAQRWVRSLDRTRPFFMWLSFAEPHNPYQVPDPYFSMFPVDGLPPTATDKSALEDMSFKWHWTRQLGEYSYPNYDELLPRARANYFGMLRLIDDQVRRFVDYLRDEHLLENTIVLFMSDHGDFVGEYGLMRKGPEMPEVLMRVPLQFSGPGIVASAQARTDHVSLVDIMPTLCEAIGAEIPRGVQGRSLWPMLTGEEYPQAEFAGVYAEQGFGGLHYTEDDPLSFDHCMMPGPVTPTFDELNTYSQSGTMRMLRKCDWKLIMDMQGRGQLFNLVDDPYETHNLYAKPEYAETRCALTADLLAWTIRAQDPLPYPVGRYIFKRDQHNYYAPYE